VATVNWAGFDFERLASGLEATVGRREADRMARAFTEALRIAQLDEELLGYLLVSVVCLLARVHGCSPRDVLENSFRRSITDEEWRQTYLPLFR
jgi:hypothetical protein